MLIEVSVPTLLPLAVLGIILFYGPLQRAWFPAQPNPRATCGRLPRSRSRPKRSPAPLSPVPRPSRFGLYCEPGGGARGWNRCLWRRGLACALSRSIRGSAHHLRSLETPQRRNALLLGCPVPILPSGSPSWYMPPFHAIAVLLAMRYLWKWRPALRLALGSLVLFLLGWGHPARQAESHVSFTVYDDRQAVQDASDAGSPCSTQRAIHFHRGWRRRWTDMHVHTDYKDRR